MRILHLARAADWAAAQSAGRHPATGLAAGEFLHACTAPQLPGVLARAGGAGASDPPAPPPAVLLVLDVAACAAAGAEVRWASAGAAGGSFPHVHGAVPVDAVVAVVVLARDATGVPAAPAPGTLADLGVLDGPPAAGGGPG